MCHTCVVETENRYLEEGMEFVPFFMFIAWNALFINFTFGKGESQIIFYPSIHLWVQPYFIYVFYSLFPIKNELKLQQLAKTKSKIYIQHPPMIWTHFWKIKGYLTKIFFLVPYSENWMLDAKRPKTSANTNYSI